MAVEPVKPKRITRKINKGDVERMADLVAKRLTEVEACALLGIKYTAWANWKTRHLRSVLFDEVLSRVRAAQLESHLEHIEAAQGDDWRASDRLLAIKAPERFSQKSQVQVDVNLVQGMSDQVLLRARELARLKADALDVPASVRQIGQYDDKGRSIQTQPGAICDVKGILNSEKQGGSDT